MPLQFHIFCQGFSSNILLGSHKDSFDQGCLIVCLDIIPGYAERYRSSGGVSVDSIPFDAAHCAWTLMIEGIFVSIQQFDSYETMIHEAQQS